MGKGVEFAAPGLLSSLWSGLSQASEVMEALGCSELHALPHSKRENNFGGKKALWGKYQPKPSLLCTAKRNWKMMNLGEESEVPFALPREKCLASSPHPNLSNCLIRTLQKAKRLGLERPFPWGTRPAAAGLQPFPGLGATTLVCVSGSCQDPSLSSGPDPFPSHPTRQRGKMLQGSSIEAHLAQSESSAPAAVKHLSGEASRGLLVGTQLPPFVGVREHQWLLEASHPCSPESLLLTPQSSTYTHFPLKELWDLPVVGLFSARIPIGLLQGSHRIHRGSS